MILQIEDLSVQFGGLHALNGVSLQVAKGSITGLIGPNGAGKTTLFNCITGFLRPTSGHISLQDKLISKIKPDKIVKLGVGRTFQNIQLFKSLTVRENILLALDGLQKGSFFRDMLRLASCRHYDTLAQKKVDEIIQFLGLQAEQDKLASELPLGIKRRVEIGRLIALEAKLALLDEPASGMNTTEVGEISKLILRLRNELGMTVFLVEHNMPLVMKLCDRVSVLNFGQKIAEGTPKDIKESPDVISAYIGTQRS